MKVNKEKHYENKSILFQHYFYPDRVSFLRGAQNTRPSVRTFSKNLFDSDKIKITKYTSVKNSFLGVLRETELCSSRAFTGNDSSVKAYFNKISKRIQH